jgi:hypothetical protein
VPSVELIQELQQKALKYSIMAMTNILFKAEKDLIFYKKLSILSILQENCKFEVDPQMNLRLLYLLNISLQKQYYQDRRQYRKPGQAAAENEDEGSGHHLVGGDVSQGGDDLHKGELNQQGKEIQS